jgi:hypothetical protein
MMAGAMPHRERQVPDGRVLLLAGFPGEDEDVPAAWLLDTEEALLSFTRAALANGLTLAMPLDHVAAPLVAHTAAEYVPPPQMERVEPIEPLVEMFADDGWDTQLEQSLTGLEHARMVSLGDRPPPDADDSQSSEDARGTARHSTLRILERVRPVVAVMLGDTRRLVDDFFMLREYGIPLHVVTTLPGAHVVRSDLREYDITSRFLAEIDWPNAQTEDDHPSADGSRVLPYPYLMQRLVERIGENAGTDRPPP